MEAAGGPAQGPSCTGSGENSRRGRIFSEGNNGMKRKSPLKKKKISSIHARNDSRQKKLVRGLLASLHQRNDLGRKTT